MIDYCSCGEILISQAPVTWDALLRAGVAGVVLFAATTNTPSDFEDAIKPTSAKSSMTRSEKIIFWGGIYFLVFLFSVTGWFILAFLAWYVKRIPERRLPMTSLLTGNQQKFYDWLSDFLASWLRSSIGWTFLIGLIEIVLGVILWFVASYFGYSVAFILSNPFFLIGLAYLTVVISTLQALNGTLFMKWQVLFWQAEPTVKMLVGVEQYEIMTEDEKNQVRRNVVDSLVGINKATLVVSGGELKIMNPPAGDLARFGGPGVLVVQEGHAVVLEQSGRISRVVGRGLTFLKMFERVGMVVPLITRSEKFEVKNAVTQDQVVIPSIKILVFHKILKGTRLRDNGTYPFDESIIRNQIWSPRGNDWRGAVASVGDSAVRDVVARHTFYDVVLATDEARKELRAEIKKEINLIMNKLGVEVSTLNIGEVEMPHGVTDKMIERWTASINRQIEILNAEKDRDVMIRRSEAEAKTLKNFEDIKTSLRDVLIRQLTDPLRGPGGAPISDADIAKRYIEAIEKISLTLMRDDVAPLRYIEALEKIAQSEGPKTVILGDPNQILNSGMNPT